MMCKAILSTLESVLADRWTAETARAWTDLWETAMAAMGSASPSLPPSCHSLLAACAAVPCHSNYTQSLTLRFIPAKWGQTGRRSDGNGG